MNDEDYAQLLQELRVRTRELGRRDLDELLFESRVVDASSSREAVLAYLYGLRDDVRLRSATTAQEVLRRFETFRTEEGTPVEGVVVDIQEWDRQTINADVVDLAESSVSDETIAEIDDLIAAIAEDDGLR